MDRGLPFDSGVRFLSSLLEQCAVPIALRRRRAAIFTHDAFIFRPVFGQPLRVPLAGVKRVYSVPLPPGEYEVPTVCIDFIVGEQIQVGLDVKHSDEIIRRLQEATARAKRD